MTTHLPADWSLLGASSSAPVLGNDPPACPVFENYILIFRSYCPTKGPPLERNLFSISLGCPWLP
jgi:hypothetical protein